MGCARPASLRGARGISGHHRTEESRQGPRHQSALAFGHDVQRHAAEADDALCHAAPDIGGDTAFANQELAYEALSAGLRATVDGLRAVHTAAGLAAVYGEDPKNAPRAEHPVVRTHDETGRRALYVCRAFTQHFVGWRREESAALLEYLFQHSARPEFQARHVWQAGDVAMWDNRSLLHFAVHDHGDAPRVIHRLQVEGGVPV